MPGSGAVDQRHSIINNQADQTARMMLIPEDRMADEVRAHTVSTLRFPLAAPPVVGFI